MPLAVLKEICTECCWKDWATFRGEPALRYKQAEKKVWYYSSWQSHGLANRGSQDPVPGSGIFCTRVISACPNTLLPGREWIKAGSFHMDSLFTPENLDRCQFNLSFLEAFQFWRIPQSRTSPQKVEASQGRHFCFGTCPFRFQPTGETSNIWIYSKTLPNHIQPFHLQWGIFGLTWSLVEKEKGSCFCGQRRLIANICAENKCAFLWKRFQTPLLTRKREKSQTGRKTWPNRNKVNVIWQYPNQPLFTR